MKKNSQKIKGVRRKTLPLMLGAALAQLPLLAVADSGTGVDTTLGNAMNRPVNTVTAGAPVNPDGMGTNSPAAHTPSGQMYDIPLLPVEEVKKTEGGWEYFGHVEAGFVNTRGDKNAQGFKRYKDTGEAVQINNFGLSMEKKDAASFFEITGGGLARDDQFYGMSFGRYNDWKVKAFYNETPHVFTTNYRNIYSGLGTNTLSLAVPGVAPGTANVGVANAAPTIAAMNAINAAGNSNLTELGLIRKKGGARLEMNLNDSLKFFASYTNEKREGTRPFGMVLAAGPGGAFAEIPESIDYTTHDLLAGVQYNDDLNSLNASFSASYFRNHIDTLTVDYPVAVALNAAAGGTAATKGQFDLYPNNDAYNAKVEYARLLPALRNGRFTAVASYDTSRQNDNLVAPALEATGAGAVWNTTAALSQSSAKAKIDTKLLDLGLSFTPVDNLDVKGKVRYQKSTNNTNYVAYNPLTGQYGRLINNGLGAALVDPRVALAGAVGAAITPAGNVQWRNIPFANEQLIYSLAGDYRLSNTASVNASYERETIKREHREREKTWEDKVKLGYVNRAIENATLRLSFEQDRRRGSAYNADPYHEFYTPSLYAANALAAFEAANPGRNLATWVIHMNGGMRKMDLADRDQNILNARVNYMFRPDLDGGVTLQMKRVDYDNEGSGRERSDQDSLNFDLNYQASAEQSIYGFYSWQVGKTSQRGMAGANNCIVGTTVVNGTVISSVADALARCALPSTGLPNNAAFNTANAWSVDMRDANETLGLGFKQDFGGSRLDVNYTYNRGKTRYAISGTGTQAANAAGSIPDQSIESHVLDGSWTIPVNKVTSARLFYRYENGKINDHHYALQSGSPVPAATANFGMYLDGGPQSYTVHQLGVMFNFKM